MLFTAAHLLLTIGLLSFCALLGGMGIASVSTSEALVWWGGAASAVFALLMLSWPLYRLGHLRPLGLPFCPHCAARHYNCHVPPDAWPIAILFCATCEKPVRLCLTRTPSLYLRWPEFLGIW